MSFSHNTTDPTGYLALDKSHKLIILAFRGTAIKDDSHADFNASLVPVEDVLCEGCSAHGGFLSYRKSIQGHITAKIQNATAEYPDYDLTVVGHSLGGAVATLAGTFLRKANYTLDLVSVRNLPPSRG